MSEPYWRVGDAVIWLHTPRDRAGHPVPVAAVVISTTIVLGSEPPRIARVRIRLQHGGTRSVRPENLVERKL